MIRNIYIKGFTVLFLVVFSFIIFLSFQNNNKIETKDSFVDTEKMISTEPLKIGFITDAHCYSKFNKESGEWDLNWRCEKPLNAFVEGMNNDFKPDFVIENGDLTDGRDDRGKEVFIKASNIFDKIEAPKYHVLGNHETRNFIKEDWLSMTNNKKSYYYYDVNGYRIIVLDGNNRPLTEGIDSYDTDPENKFYPGFLDPEQVKWLEDLFEKSKRYEKIVFVHQPVFPTDLRSQDELFLGGAELRKLFSENHVKAVFSGHTERFCHLNEDGVNYYVFQGFFKDNKQLKEEFRFKEAGIFSEISINNEDIDIVVNYNPKEKDDKKDGGYLSINFSKINANCLNNETLLSSKKEDNK